MMRRPHLALFALVAGTALLAGYAVQGQQQCGQAAASYGPQPAVCYPPQAVCAPQSAVCCPAQGVCCAVPCPPPVFTPAAQRCAVPSPENTKLVQELRVMLQETTSRDTFLLTIKALSDLGPDAKAAVPSIIRSAERLGLSKDIEQQMEKEEGPGVLVVECLERILAATECTPCRPRYAAGVIAMPPTAYAPPPPMFACPPAPGLPCPVVPTIRRMEPPAVPSPIAEPIPPPSVR